MGETYDSGEMYSWDVCTDVPTTSDGFSVKSGPCAVGVGSYKGCVLRENYGNNEECIISVPDGGATLYSHKFSTEAGYDFLFIDGTGFSGPGTYIHGVQATHDIIWTSDTCTTRAGWV